MTYAIIPVTGAIEYHIGKPELDDLQRAVGGYVEVLGIPEGAVMWMNEHGRIMDPPLATNYRASMLTGTAIVGNVVLTGPADEEGEVTDLPEAAKVRLEALPPA